MQNTKLAFRKTAFAFSTVTAIALCTAPVVAQSAGEAASNSGAQVLEPEIEAERASREASPLSSDQLAVPPVPVAPVTTVVPSAQAPPTREWDDVLPYLLAGLIPLLALIGGGLWLRARARSRRTKIAPKIERHQASTTQRTAPASESDPRDSDLRREHELQGRDSQ